MKSSLPENLPEPPRRGGGDLHLHSSFSDGSFRPAKLINLAEEAGLEFVSLTDHDTVAGLEQFLEAAEDSPVEAVPGVELSCAIHDGRYHILGYYIDWERPVLQRRLEYYEKERRKRVEQMIEVLSEETQYNLKMEDIEQHAGARQLGKPHVAKAMVERGIVDTVREAFDQFLAEGQLLDQVPKERMGVREAVQLIEESNGVPILAHPVHYEADLDISQFKPIGVQGLEVYYADHTEEQRQQYYNRARELDFLVTGGSDFHGDVKPEVEIGDVRLPKQFFEALKRRALREGSPYREIQS